MTDVFMIRTYRNGRPELMDAQFSTWMKAQNACDTLRRQTGMGARVICSERDPSRPLL